MFLAVQCLFKIVYRHSTYAISVKHSHLQLVSVQIVLTNQVTHKVTNEGSKMVPALGVKHSLILS